MFSNQAFTHYTTQKISKFTFIVIKLQYFHVFVTNLKHKLLRHNLNILNPLITKLKVCALFKALFTSKLPNLSPGQQLPSGVVKITYPKDFQDKMSFEPQSFLFALASLT